MKITHFFFLFFVNIIGLFPQAHAQEIAQSYFISAKEYVKKADFNLALIELDTAIKLSPNYAELYELKGDIFEIQGKERRSIGQYSLAILYNPNNIKIYLKRAALHYKLKDHRNYVLNDINEAIRLEPNNANLYQLKGFYYAHTFNPKTLKPDYENAIILLNSALLIDPKYAPFYYNRSDYKLKSKQHLSSLLDINKAIELDNSTDLYYHQRAIIRFVMGDFRPALNDINQAIEIKASSNIYFQFRGNIFYNLKKYSRSYEDYSIAINLIFEQITKTDEKIISSSLLNLQLRQTLLLRGMASVQGNKPFDGCDDFSKALQMGEKKANNYIRQYCN